VFFLGYFILIFVDTLLFRKHIVLQRCFFLKLFYEMSLFINSCNWLKIITVIIEISILFFFIGCYEYQTVHCNGGHGKYYLIK